MVQEQTQCLASWIDSTEMLPDINKKYLVIIDCDGVLKESYCSFNTRNKKFHFDMPNIKWKVVKWLKTNLNNQNIKEQIDQ